MFYVAFNNQDYIATGLFTGGGNQCILYCKPPGIGKLLTTFQHEEVGGENKIGKKLKARIEVYRY